jgi:hypothetical protein
MASTNFVDFSTPIVAAWLNDINSFFYSLFQGATTPAQALAAIGALGSANPNITGNLTFLSNGARIRGNMSDALTSNRLFFQSSSVNLPTVIGAIPNGTNTVSALQLYSNSNPDNSAFCNLTCDASNVQLAAAAHGTGVFGQLAFATNNIDRMTIDVAGNIIVPTLGARFRFNGSTGAPFNNRFAFQEITANTSTALAVIPNGTGSVAEVDVWASSAMDNCAIGQVAINNAVGTFSILSGAVGTGTVFPIVFTLNNTERMRILPTGEVGIGTFTPTARLDVRAASGAPAAQFGISTDFVGFTTNTGGSSFMYLGSTTCTNWTIGTQQNIPFSFMSNNTIRMTVGAGGNVGIASGEDPNVRLIVRAQSANNTQYAFLLANSTPLNIFFVRNDGAINTGLAPSSPFNLLTASAPNLFVDSGGTLLRSTFVVSSSLRYKQDVAPYTRGLTDLLRLEPMSFKFKPESSIGVQDKVYAGLIAESVDELGLTEFVAYDNEERPESLHYDHMVVMLINAIKELNARIAVLEAV